METLAEFEATLGMAGSAWILARWDCGDSWLTIWFMDIDRLQIAP